MKIKYLYELQYKSEEYFRELFGPSYDKVMVEFGKRGIIKSNSYLMALEYVGIIVVEDQVISILPKFLIGEKHNQLEDTKLILKVLNKYSSTNQDLFNTLEVQSENGINKISLIDYLFKDFIEYYLYSAEKEIFELNGSGEIDWEKTIEGIDPVVIRNVPCYTELYTLETDPNESHYIKRLHQSVLIGAKEYIENLEVGELFSEVMNIPNFDFNVNEDGLGDSHYQVMMIEKQLMEEFNERKINLLLRMKDFILEENLDSDDSIEFFGVNKFWSVWEKVCQFVFKNQYTQKNDLGNIIKKETAPRWKNRGNKKSMIPDIVSIENEKIYIFDAKYYTLEGDSFPGVQDVAKQFIYEEVFRRSYLDKIFYNAFLCPGIENSIVDNISMNYFKERNIDVIKVDYYILFCKYIDDSHKNIGEYYKVLFSK